MAKKLTKQQSTTVDHTLITEQNTSNDVKEQYRENEQKIFLEISERLPYDICHMFGGTLGLETNVIMELEKERNVHNYQRNFVIFRMLEKWKNKTNLEEGRLVSLLAEALRKIQRNDIAEDIEKGKLIGHHQESCQLLNDSDI